ncbi:hypothetical protein [Streptomyces echinatus]|uniref:acyl-CoA-like ligand-binding transcription factor n=1 Tax=Streptomyces echinatus TaxID=67293 RepID=UPI003CD07477
MSTTPPSRRPVRARPTGEPIVDAILGSLKGSLGAMLQQDRESLLLRTRLTLNDPALRARNVADEQERSERAMAEVIAERHRREAHRPGGQCAARRPHRRVHHSRTALGGGATGRRTWRRCTEAPPACCREGGLLIQAGFSCPRPGGVRGVSAASTRQQCMARSDRPAGGGVRPWCCCVRWR